MGHVTRVLSTEREVEAVVQGTQVLYDGREEIEHALTSEKPRCLRLQWDMQYRLRIWYRCEPHWKTLYPIETAIRRYIGKCYPVTFTPIWNVQLELSEHIPDKIWKQRTHMLDRLPEVQSAGINELGRRPTVVLQLLQPDTSELIVRITAILQW